MLVDSHCHLDYPPMAEDLSGTLARARNAGVGTLLTIGTKLRDFPRVRAIAEANENVFCSVGIHPHEAQNEAADAAKLVELARHAKVVGIGETGLDYYYDKSPREKQRENFRAHMRAAEETGLPLIVHTRDAEEDTAQILEEAVRQGGVTGVLHCFTGSAELARKALDLGFFISLSGIVTFKNARDLQETAKWIPPDQMLVETDAPFLAPVPHRGQKCEPAFVADTAVFVADLRGEDVEALGEATTANFFKLFPKAAGEA